MSQMADAPRQPAADPGTPARTIEVESDVTDAVDLGEQCALRGTVFVPVTGTGPRTVLVVVPGGTYTRAYWHLVVPGRAGYSFAEDFARRGAVVVALDNLGTGASSRPADGDRLTPEMIARANHAAARDVIDRLAAGTLDPDLESIPVERVVGVGHSMGGLLTVVAQATSGDYDAIAVLGTSFLGDRLAGNLEPGEMAALLVARSTHGDEDGYLTMPRGGLRSMFHGGDVPDDVIAADDASATRLPRTAGAATATARLLAHYPGAVRVPVFLAFGDSDISSDPTAEPNAYGSADVTLFLLPASAHCHNMAGTRQLLWDRLAAWLGEAH